MATMAASQPGLDLQSGIHRRRNLLTGEWVLVSPQRSTRPWQGQTEAGRIVVGASYEPGCYLCPGNTRAGGIVNPRYESTFVFENDFAALHAAAPSQVDSGPGLLQARPESGVCRVISYSARHDLSMGEMAVADIRRVVDTWVEEYRSLGALPHINAVTIFENRGAMMGASSPHPHGQVWANESIPDAVAKECAHQLSHRARSGSCLLCDYLALELGAAERLVCHNEHFVALVPFWAVWPFETLLLPRTHGAALSGLDGTARDALAAILKDLVTRYDALFNVEFPYTMGLHQQPTDGVEHPHWHWHGHFYPPLLRSATVRKFMVGYEMLAGPQRDITPEAAAERLRALR
jgi:UDPglucose--hexose-1-phosphate uridylyltransferase